METYKHCIIVIILACVYFTTDHYINSNPEIPNIPDKNYWGPGSAKPDDEAIEPFKINVPDSVLDDLQTRLSLDLRAQPSLEGTNFDYGFRTEELKKIIEFWKNTDKYNWRDRESILNALPQFITQISGLNLHFIHVKPDNVPSNVSVVPLLLLHGWPGSVKEFYELIPLLTSVDRERDFVFEVISPSLPGFAFSEASHKPGLSPAHMAAMFRQLMLRLGHDKFYVQGGDWGAIISADMSTLYPQNILGMHSTMCAVNSAVANLYLFAASFAPTFVMDQDTADAIFPLSKLISFLILESGYMHIQATKPDTIGVGLANSPVGLAAYILEKFSTWTDPAHRGLSDGGLTRKFALEDLLDNIMLYWVNGAVTSSMRIYAECFQGDYLAQQWDRLHVIVPAVCVQFPHELMRMPDIVLRLKYKNLLPTSPPSLSSPLHLALRPPRGGHFNAMEEPLLLANSIIRAVELFRETAQARQQQE